MEGIDRNTDNGNMDGFNMVVENMLPKDPEFWKKARAAYEKWNEPGYEWLYSVGAQIYDSVRDRHYPFGGNEWIPFGPKRQDTEPLPKESFRLLKESRNKDVVQEGGYYLMGHVLSEIWCFL